MSELVNYPESAPMPVLPNTGGKMSRKKMMGVGLAVVVVVVVALWYFGVFGGDSSSSDPSSNGTAPAPPAPPAPVGPVLDPGCLDISGYKCTGGHTLAGRKWYADGGARAAGNASHEACAAYCDGEPTCKGFRWYAASSQACAPTSVLSDSNIAPYPDANGDIWTYEKA